MSSAVTPNSPVPPERPPERTPATAHGADEPFSRSLHYEFAGEEGRALLSSYAFSVALGVAWLAFVYFGPRTLPMQLLPRDERPIAVTFDMPEPTQDAAAAEEAAAAAPPVPKERSGGRPRTSNPAAIANAFGNSSPSGGLVGDVSNVLRNVDVSSGSGGAAGANTNGAKVVLGAGEGGEGSRTPGRGGIGRGLGSGTGGIGVGAGTGAVSRTPVRIAPPRPIDAPKVGGVQRDVSELGTIVRSHESQLRFCYNEYGLKVNPSLAGSVTTSVSLAPGGGVTAVNVTKRTWSGAGASDTERCISEKMRGWHFPPSEAGDGTFSFSFSFTR